MASSHLLSIIIPVYNRRNLIDEVLNHIYSNMDYNNIEVIIFDDASKDGSCGTAQKYPCKVIRSTQNVGPAVGRNIAAKEARGNILFFTDSDVILQPDALTLAEDIIENTDYDGVVGILDPVIRFENFASNYKNLYLHYMLKILPESTFFFNGSLSAIKRDAYFDVGGFDEKYGNSPCEDLELGNRLARKYKLCLSHNLIGEHIKHYTVFSCLMKGFHHAKSIMKMFLRERFEETILEDKSRSKQTPPKSYIFSVGLLALALVMLLSGYIINPLSFLFAGLCLITIYGLNSKFLLFLKRKKGNLFFLQSSLFLCFDLFFIGIGVFVGMIEYCLGNKY